MSYLWFAWNFLSSILKCSLLWPNYRCSIHFVWRKWFYAEIFHSLVEPHFFWFVMLFFFFPVPQLLRIKMSLQWFRSARFYSFVNLPGKAFVLGPGYSLCGCKVLLKVNVRSLWADGDSCFKSLSTANTQKLSGWFLLKQRSGRPNVWILRRDLELVKADLSPEKGTSALASSLEGRGDSGCRPL